MQPGSLLDSMWTKIPGTVGRSHAERAVRPVAVHRGRGRWPVALLGHRALSRGRFVGYSPSEKASPHSAAGVDAGTTVPGHPVPGPGRDASWEPRQRTIETVDSADGQDTAPTSSGVGRPRWACLRPNTKGQ